MQWTPQGPLGLLPTGTHRTPVQNGDIFGCSKNNRGRVLVVSWGVEEEERRVDMARSSLASNRLKAGTKYVLVSCGPMVLRHIELPDGRKIKLPIRKAADCTCLERRTAVAEKNKADHITA